MYLLHFKDTITMTDQDLLIFVGSIKFTCLDQYMPKPSVKFTMCSYDSQRASAQAPTPWAAECKRAIKRLDVQSDVVRKRQKIQLYQHILVKTLFNTRFEHTVSSGRNKTM